MESAPPDRRGAANATIFAAMDIGVAIGSTVLGLISVKFGFTVTFIVTAAMIFMDLIVFSIMNKELPSYDNVINESHVIMMGTEQINDESFKKFN